MATHTGFWLNLDAERELAAPDAYRPDPRIEARIRGLLPQLAGLLTTHGRVIGKQPLAPGSPALAWCPTPSARAAIAAADLVIAPCPPLDVLQRVNHRAFCASLGQTLPGAAQVQDMQALRECIGRPSPSGDWVIKRPFGFAGRERRRALGGLLDVSTEGFVRASLQRGESLQVEPWVERRLDVAIHGFLRRDGRLALAPPILQQCDVQGRFQRSLGAAENHLDPAFDRALHAEGERVGRALHAAEYFGPFGVDGFTYLDGQGRLRLNPRSEINARLTMGYVWPEGRPPSRG